MEKPRKTPEFLRTFSKKDPEERSETAQRIQDARQEKRQAQQQLEQLEASKLETEQGLAERLERLDELRDLIEWYSEGLLSELTRAFKIRVLKQEIRELQQEVDEQSEKRDGIVNQIQELNEVAEEKANQANDILSEYYASLPEKWEQAPYTAEDIREQFSEEHLASLSLEDYILLLKRYPAEMVTHVTRQGVRDHGSLVFHAAGAGQLHNGLKSMLTDGRLRSPLGIHLAQSEKVAAIGEFLGLDGFDDADSATEEMLKMIDVQAGQGSYADRNAVHVATEEVANEFYGAENGNEVFIAFPSTHIAASHYYAGQLTKAEGGYWNDQWVWTREQAGMDVNAGIVFLPSDAHVNPDTGSQYEVVDGGAVRDEQVLQHLETVVATEAFHTFASEVCKLLKEKSRMETSRNHRAQKELQSNIDELCTRARSDFSIEDPGLEEVLFSYNALFTLSIYADPEASTPNKQERLTAELQKILKESGRFYKRSGETVTSEDYWEQYFAAHPEQKPSKYVYYSGGDPTKALHDWRKKHGLSRRAERQDFDVPDARVSQDSEVATEGRDRFKSLAQEAIARHFS